MNDGKKPKVVLVDDDAIVLLALEDKLSRSFEVHTARSAIDAIKIIRDIGPVCAVVADYVLPEIKGDAFLRWMSEAYPTTARVMYSAYSKFTETKSFVDDFILKPAQVDVVRSSIERVIEKHERECGTRTCEECAKKRADSHPQFRQEIMLVDNDSLSLRPMRRSLSDVYTVHLVPTAQIGLAILSVSDTDKPISVVLSDIIVSGMEGKVFRNIVRERYRGTGQILHSRSNNIHTIAGYFDEYVQQPATSKKLRESIDRVIQKYPRG